jgi:segregation and condensation protein B
MFRSIKLASNPGQLLGKSSNYLKDGRSNEVKIQLYGKSPNRLFFEDYLKSQPEKLSGPHFPIVQQKGGDPEEDIEVRLLRLEGVLFISREPLTTRRLAQLAVLADATEARTLIRRLNERYEKVGRSFRIEEVGGGFEMLTKPQFAPWLRRLGHVPQEERLTSAAMEVLAIIAYRQPVMRADIEAIRGVGSEEVLKQLLSRDLVRICGRSEELGRPYLYGTTKRFLKMFGLKSLEKLPRADWINETWDVEEAASDLESQPMSSTLPMRNNVVSPESTVGLQELQDLVDNRNSEIEQVNSVDLQPGTDTKESIVKLAHSAIGLAFESEENLEEQLAVASRLASIPVAVDEDEDFEDDDEEFEDEEDEDFEEFEDDEEDEELDEEVEEDFDDEEEDEDEVDDDEAFEEDDWEEVEEGDEEEEEEDEEEEEEEWEEEDDEDWDDDEEEEEEEDEDWE